MLIFSVIAYSALLIAIVSGIAGIRGKYRYYWLSAFAIYIFSFLAGFSIGQMTVGLTFIPLTLAIGHSIGWIKTRVHRGMFLLLGVFIGFTMVVLVGSLLFYPLFFLFS